MPGTVYFPCGTPDLVDVTAEGTLDLAGSVARELLEETGLDAGRLEARARLDAGARPRLSRHDEAPYGGARMPNALRSRILRYLAGEPQPEFSDIHIVRGRDDLDAGHAAVSDCVF